MRKTWLFYLVAGSLAACAPGTGTDSSNPDPGKPSNVISDGNHLGDPSANPDFFFLPPLVSNPRGSLNWSAGQFNANLTPSVIVCELPAGSTELNITASTPCKTGGYSKTFPFGTTGWDVVRLHRPKNGDADDDADDDGDGDGHYHVKWTVPNSDAVFFRAAVWQGNGDLALGPLGTRIGFADVEGLNSGKDLKNAHTGEFIVRRDGSTLNVKFRIENRALCTPPGDYTKPCASATTNFTTTVTIATTTAGTGLPTGVVIPAQTGTPPPPVTFTVQPCAPGHILVDLPVFGSCIQVTSNPQLLRPLTNPGVVFVCDYTTPSLSALAHEQRELVALHAEHPAPFNYTEALVEANGNCPVPSVQMSGSMKGMLASLFRGEWRAAGREFGNLIQPKPLMAMFLHAGGGGVTGLQSSFQFALPCKMEIGSGNNEVRPPSGQVQVTVHVTDLFGGPCEHANVHFAVEPGVGSVLPAAQLSDGSGNASVTWTLGSGVGVVNTLNATGFGIADPSAGNHGQRVAPGDFLDHTLVSSGCNALACAFPAQTFDPFIPKYLDFGGIKDVPAAGVSPNDGTGGVTLKLGILQFTATSGAPMNVFDFGSSGFTYLADLAFDGTDPRNGGHSGGETSAPANWYGLTLPGGDWLTGAAAFGSRYLGCSINSTQSGDVITDHFATGWSPFTDIVARKSFSTPYDGKLTITLRIDNDAQIWLDGTRNITPNAPATTSGGYDSGSGWWFHDNCADNANPVFVVTGVPAGNHLLAIRGHDYGEASYLDVKVDLAP